LDFEKVADLEHMS
jgi:hypothetical protein